MLNCIILCVCVCVCVYVVIDPKMRKIIRVFIVCFLLIVLEQSVSTLKLTGNHTLTLLKPDDLKNLCRIAGKYYTSPLIPFIIDTEVDEARIYTFQYTEGREIPDIAVQCRATPSMYLRWESSTGKTKIKLTFLHSVADHYNYRIEVTRYFHHPSTSK